MHKIDRLNSFWSVVFYSRRDCMNKTILNKIKLGTLSLSAIALLAACGNDTPTETPTVDDPAVEEPVEEPGAEVAPEEPADEEPEQAGPADTSNGIHNVEFPVSLDQAVQIFYDTFGENINIDEIELDEDIRGFEYSISGWDDNNDYDIDISAQSGEIKSQETEPDNDSDDTINLDNIITPQEAMDIATADAGVDFVEGWTLEVDDGLTVFEIDLNGADDITINAETGDIVDR